MWHRQVWLCFLYSLMAFSTVEDVGLTLCARMKREILGQVEMIKSACHDNQAEQYDNRIKNDQQRKNDYIRENYDKINEYVITLLNLNPGDSLLDIGIGTALLEEKIKQETKIYGIDISEKMIEKAKQKGLPIELKVGSFLGIPYPASTFSKLVTCFAFHHLTDEEKSIALTEMCRVITKNGMIVIADFMVENEGAKEELLNYFKINNRLDMIEEMDDENFTNIEWLRKVMQDKGFRIVYERKSTLSWVVKLWQ